MKRYLAITLFCAGMMGISCHGRDGIKLDSAILRLIDGRFINVGMIIGYGRNVSMLVNGAKKTDLSLVQQVAAAYQLDLPYDLAEGNREQARIGLIWYQGRYHTVKDMIEIERSGTANPDELNDALMHAATHFDQFSKDYVQDIQTAKNYMVKLIDQWATLRNRPDTILRDWSKQEGGERDSIYNTMTSFTRFGIFVDDLLLFLRDLSENCPKSYKAYRESMKQNGAAS